MGWDWLRVLVSLNIIQWHRFFRKKALLVAVKVSTSFMKLWSYHIMRRPRYHMREGFQTTLKSLLTKRFNSLTHFHFLGTSQNRRKIFCFTQIIKVKRTSFLVHHKVDGKSSLPVGKLVLLSLLMLHLKVNGLIIPVFENYFPFLKSYQSGQFD